MTIKSSNNQLRMILASASPRRRELLARAGYEFDVVVPQIQEAAFPTEGAHPAPYARKLALAKAENVAERFPDALVIGADTIVDFNGEIIGKPADAKEAELITRKLFCAPHRVITGVALVRLSDGTKMVESDTTVVYPRKLTDEQIAAHISSKSWRDKAGAYAIRENGDKFIERIEGSLTNVMGLPMELLHELLEEFPG